MSVMFEPDREPISRTVVPHISLVDRLVVVESRVREECRVQCVVGVVMAEHDVGHRPHVNAGFPKRVEDHVPVGDHAGVDHHDRIAIDGSGSPCPPRGRRRIRPRLPARLRS